MRLAGVSNTGIIQRFMQLADEAGVKYWKGSDGGFIVDEQISVYFKQDKVYVGMRKEPYAYNLNDPTILEMKLRTLVMELSIDANQFGRKAI